MTEAAVPELHVRQYLVCRFSPNDKRTYTYHNDMEPVAAGDRVEVNTARGLSVVRVEAITNQAPNFPTKHIAGPYRPDDQPEKLL